ncbi:YopX family protein [Chryseobacterium sp. SSA4.19]|uniref:YopX family protein n=1 Tax=Chryseobacterium sp. SSA4.19 TaxID=2919915 RepID=UPI001F4DA6EB|nr:YopX family protein [Chryseobacterium sp. SSA4.19]MCJ8153207.1 YopX family protein [Chryseobacterium sp. SSA4.19]
MRQIKFRIWDTEDMIYPDQYFNFINASFWNIKTTEEKTIKLDTLNYQSLMQYTGIKDMEGNEIYEGDILRNFNGKKYVILWDSGDAGFVSVDLKEYILKPESRLDERDLVWVVCEVIGNIHENPELLK